MWINAKTKIDYLIQVLVSTYVIKKNLLIMKSKVIKVEFVDDGDLHVKCISSVRLKMYDGKVVKLTGVKHIP